MLEAVTAFQRGHAAKVKEGIQQEVGIPQLYRTGARGSGHPPGCPFNDASLSCPMQPAAGPSQPGVLPAGTVAAVI